jgi:hypothetical protein
LTDHFTVFITATIIDALGQALAFLFVVSLRERFGNYMAVLIGGVAFEACLAAVFWPVEAEVSKTFALTRAAGRVVEMLTAWVFVLYRLGFLNGRGRR